MSLFRLLCDGFFSYVMGSIVRDLFMSFVMYVIVYSVLPFIEFARYFCRSFFLPFFSYLFRSLVRS